MKMIIDKDHKNAKGKKWRDGHNLRRYYKIKLKSKSPADDPELRTIEFGAPWSVNSFNPNDFKKGDQEIYEAFCCGYLHYYDAIYKKNTENHSIYFEWEKDKVSIYLFPDPIRTASGVDPEQPPNPPPPEDSI